jgi:hypothetical protein
MTAIQRIISGGQTGADRAALDWAIEHGIPHGGWCLSATRFDFLFVPLQLCKGNLTASTTPQV